MGFIGQIYYYSFFGAEAAHTRYGVQAGSYMYSIFYLPGLSLRLCAFPAMVSRVSAADADTMFSVVSRVCR